jgi:autoinducer 2 (AI-2) kinase
MQAAAKWRWLRSNRPAVAGRVTTVVPLADWIGWRICRRAAMTRTLAIENGMLDVTSGAIRPIDGLSSPPVVVDGTCTGGRGGTPVVLAGADTQCALLGMGATGDGQCGVAAGWSAPVQLVTERQVLDAKMRTWTGAHVLHDRWVLESNAGDTGRAFDWLCSLLGLSHADGEALAATAAAGSSDVVAVLGPRAMNAAQMNAGIGGMTFPLPLVMAVPDRPAMLRTVLESTAFAIRANLEQIEDVSRRRVESGQIGGGMSRSETFAQILADVLDRSVEVARAPETSAVGAAILASVAVRLHASIDDAVAAMTAPRRTAEPRPRESATYDDTYARWCAMCDEFERMAGL